MRFTVLGSGTARPDADRGPAGFLVTTGGKSWLVDGGSGTLQRCAKAGVEPVDLAGGIYSHIHPDHTGDLVPLLFALRHAPPPRHIPYPIWAGKGFARFLATIREAYGSYGEWLFEHTPVTEHALQPDQVSELGGLRLRTSPATHSGFALHLRFEADGLAVVFSGDTGPSEHLIELCRGADLLVCECALPAGSDYGKHLSAPQIAHIVRQSGVPEVWITHLYPDVDAGRAVATLRETGAKVHRARDGDVWTQ